MVAFNGKKFVHFGLTDINPLWPAAAADALSIGQPAPVGTHPLTLTPDSWKAAVNGNWNAGADWSTGAAPTSSNDATVAVAGKYTVAINSAVAVNSLTINDASATVADTGSGTLSLTTTLAVTAGTFSLGSGATVLGGTVSLGSSGVFLATGGTLSAATYQGTLTLTAANASLFLANSGTFAGAGGSGVGSINLTGVSANLYAYDLTSLNNAAVSIGNNAGNDSLTLYDTQYGVSETLTLGSQFNITQAGNGAQIRIGSSYGNATETVISQGSITAAKNGGNFTISDNGYGAFINQGSVAVSGGEQFDIEASNFSNSGSISVSGASSSLELDNLDGNTGSIADSGGTLILGGTLTSGNTGSISVSGGTLSLATTLTTATLDTIQLSGGAKVSIASGALLNNAGATLSVGTGTTFGTIQLGGTISGGIIADSGNGVASNGGTLSSVTYQGTLNLSASGANLTLVNGVTLQGAGGTGAGAINLSGVSASIDAYDLASLNNAAVSIGNNAGGDSLTLYDTQYGVNETLTLGSQFNITQAGNGAQIRIGSSYGNAATETVINQGSITAAKNGGNFTINDNGYGTFINQGSVAVSGGDYFLARASNFSNSGSISVSGANSILELDNLGGNTGSITDTGGTLILGGTLTSGNTGSVSVSGGTLSLATTLTTATLDTIQLSGGAKVSIGSGALLNNAGATLSVGTGTTFGTIQLGGTISGGIIADSGNGVASNGGTLSSVTYQGTLNVSASGANLFLVNGVTLQGAGGTGAGAINLIGTSAYLYAYDLTSLNNAALSIGNNNGTDGFFLYDTQYGVSETLTLGSLFSITQAGNLAQIYIAGSSGGGTETVINQGSITAAKNGGNFTINDNGSGAFINQGSITVSNGDTLTISTQNFGSLRAGTLSGSYEVDAKSLLELGNNAQITALAGTVTLSGSGSTIQAYSTTSSTQVTIDQRLTTINSGGALALLGGRSLVSNKVFVDSGLLSLGGGTLTQASFSIGSTGTLAGFGTVTVAVADGGAIVASGGVLTLAGAISGTGGMQINAGATLEAAAAASSQQTTSFNGLAATLKLDAPTSFASILANFAAGDVIDLSKISVTSVSSTGTTIAAVTAGGTINLTLAAPLVGQHLALSSDGASGTNITGYALAQSSIHTPEPVAFGNHHVGDSVSTALTLTNTAAANGFSEALDAALGSATGAASASGSFTSLAAGLTNSSSLIIGLNTATAGALTGTAVITENSDGSGIDGFGQTSLGTQLVNVTGAVYAYAQATTANNGTVTLVNTHVGQAATGSLTLTNSAAANGYSEALDAALGNASAGFSASGSFAGLAAGQNNSALQVGYTSTTAGAYSGTASLSLVSDGTGIDGLGTTTLTGQSVTITGAAYAYAVGQVMGTTINLGIVHVGQADSTTLTLTNAAAANGYSEALDAAWASASSGVTTGGAINFLGAGQFDTSSLSIGLATSASGAFSGTALLGLISDGTNIDGLGTTTLAGQTITISGTVDNYAQAAFQDPGGPAIAGSGTQYAINLGSVAQGSAADILALGVLNNATGLSDLLQGTISSAGGAGFTNAGFGAFSGFGAGQGEHGQSVTLSTSSAGTFTETILLSSAGTNASGYDGALATETLTITGIVTPVGSTTYTLSAGPNNIVGANGGDVFIAPTYSLNSRDSLTGGTGANVMQLSGGGQFDLGAPTVFANIPTITAYEGQLASGTVANTQQVVFLRDGSNETLSVVAGTAAKGNANAESIVIYSSNATNSITLASGADSVILAQGTDTVVLGGVKNSVTAGGGTALVQGTAAVGSAAVVGAATGSTTLEITNAGTVTLNAADTYLTVKLDGATKLTLSKLAFITANGANGHDTLIAGAANQTLIGGTADVLTGYTGGNDLFTGASAALNGDTVGNWITGDTIDLTDMSPSAKLTYTGNTTKGALTISDGTHKCVLNFTGNFTLANFAAPVIDGHGGALILYQG
jgi:hypothetical protein